MGDKRTRQLIAIAVLAIGIAALWFARPDPEDRSEVPASIATPRPVDSEPAVTRTNILQTEPPTPESPIRETDDCSAAPDAENEFGAGGLEEIDWFNTVEILDASRDPEHKVAAALLTQIVANEQARALLSASPDPEHRMADSMLSQIPEAEQLAAERLQAALIANPDDPMTLNLVYASCGYQLSFEWCDQNRVEQRLIESDGNNGATWGMIANMRTFQGDLDGALSAMQRASTSSRMHTYNPEHVALLERSLAAAGTGSYSTRAVAAIGAAFVVTHPAGDLFQACQFLSPQDHRWRMRCEEFGRAIERQAVGEVDYRFGLLLQEAVLSNVGDQAGLAVLEERAAQRTPRKPDAGAGDFGTAFWKNDALVAEFVNALVNADEFAAFEYYEQEREAWVAERCGADR